MNPATVKLIATAFSMKREIKLFAFVFILVCLLPIFAVVILTQAGLHVVSDALAVFDPQLAQVDIRDPATGNIIDHIATTATWPVGGPVSLEFGEIHLPYQPLHTGIDIATTDRRVGDPVIAFMAGTVTYAGEQSWGFGKHVIIDHGHHVSSIYAHLDSISATKGQEVEAGTIIGTRGDTGWSTGPHLHFQINIFGIPVNPRLFLTGDPPEDGDELAP